MKKATIKNKDGKTVKTFNYKRHQFINEGVVFLNDRSEGSQILDPVYFCPYSSGHCIDFETNGKIYSEGKRLMEKLKSNGKIFPECEAGVEREVDLKPEIRVIKVEIPRLQIRNLYRNFTVEYLDKELFGNEEERQDVQEGDFIYLKSKNSFSFLVVKVDKVVRKLLIVQATPQEYAEVLTQLEKIGEI